MYFGSQKFLTRLKLLELGTVDLALKKLDHSLGFAIGRPRSNSLLLATLLAQVTDGANEYLDATFVHLQTNAACSSSSAIVCCARSGGLHKKEMYRHCLTVSFRFATTINKS